MVSARRIAIPSALIAAVACVLSPAVSFASPVQPSAHTLAAALPSVAETQAHSVHPSLRHGNALIAPSGELSWRVLMDTRIVQHPNTNGRYGAMVAYYAERKVRTEVEALQGKRVKFQGFAMPLDAAPKVRRFILAAKPTNCGFCVPGGPESYAEVILREPARLEPDALMTIEGTLDLPMTRGFSDVVYRLDQATPVVTR